ncbi:MAG TPA: ATP12 family protein [Rhizomicrobium sp.]|jgi:chaperone required for assembly of F1-ATPase
MIEKVRRFYKHVGIDESDYGFVLLLDAKPAKTPRGAPLALPTRALAEAVAEEWRGQGERLEPGTMMLTHLAYSAIDRLGQDRGKVIEHALGFGRSDALCYRAEAPEALAARQKEIWDPLLHWAFDSLGLRLAADAGIAYIEQPADAFLRMQELIAQLDDFTLAAFDAAATATGSFMLALALIKGHESAEKAFQAAQLEELYQAEVWGRDAEAEARRLRLREELMAIGRFMGLLGPV